MARYHFEHERAHCEVARQNKIRCQAMFTWYDDETCNAYAHLHVGDLRKHARGELKRMAQFFGKFLLGPRDWQAYSYELENEYGEKFLAMAK